METLGELLERMRRGPELVSDAVAGATTAELDFVPGAGRWTIRQIVAHLTDSEMVYSDRFRRVIAEDNPTLTVVDEKVWAANLDYERRSPAEELQLIRLTRARNSSLLSSLPSRAFERAGVHSERGRLTLLDLLRIYAEHAEGHARQIRGNRDAFAQVSKVESTGL